MEDCPVVPEVVAARWVPRQQIVTDPVHRGFGTHAFSAGPQRGLRDVENGEIDEGPVQQLIDQNGSPTSNIDYSGFIRDAESFYEFEGYRRFGLEPTDAFEMVALVHRLPVSSTFSWFQDLVSHHGNTRTSSRSAAWEESQRTQSACVDEYSEQT